MLILLLTDKKEMKEIWKDIKNYEGIYQCPNYGNIKSLDRLIKNKNNIIRHKKGQLIKPKKNKNGYLQFALNKNGKREMAYVHIIIAQTFLENNNISIKHLTVNHKDGNKLNNKVTNLEFCSQSDNNKHSYKKLKRNNAIKGAKKKQVIFIDTKNKKIIIFKSIAETSRTINLSHTQINKYIYGNKKWKGQYIFLVNNNKCVEDNERI